MLSIFQTGLCPIGIDMGTHALRMMQFRRAGAERHLQAACRVELDSLDGGAGSVGGVAGAVAAIRHGLAGEDFRGRDAVLALPVSCVHAKSVRLPPMPDSDLNQALQWEARDRFGFEIGDNAGQLVWFRAGEIRRGSEVKDEILLFAVEGGVLNEYVEGLAGLGLRLAAIDLGPCAAYRSLYGAGSGGGGGTAPLALLDLGHGGAQFFIVRGEELVFYKHIEIGGKAFNEAVAAKLGIPVSEALQMRTRMLAEAGEEAAPLAQAVTDALRGPLEELARELDMCLRYYVVTFRGARPEGIAAVGRQAGVAGLREGLAAALGVPVEEAQPLRGVRDLGAAARPDRSGEWAVAAGLSLHPTKAGSALEAAA